MSNVFSKTVDVHGNAADAPLTSGDLRLLAEMYERRFQMIFDMVKRIEEKADLILADVHRLQRTTSPED